MKTSDFISWTYHLFGAIFIFTTLSYSMGYQYMPVLDTNLAQYFNEINLLSFIIFIGMLAYSESNRDFNTIRSRQTVNHGKGLWRRAWWVIGAVFLFKLNWMLLFAGGALFSIVFNLLLNHKRGKAWDYTSDSNNYDKFFRRIFGEADAGLVKIIFEIIVSQIITLQWIIN